MPLSCLWLRRSPLAAKAPTRHIGRAQALLDAGDIPAAVVELKNALQEEPKNLKARILLAQSYLDMSDAASAEAHFSRARADGADATIVAKPLAEAELQLGKFDNALSETRIPSQCLARAQGQSL